MSVQAPTRARQMLNKVPEITLFFWVIKILCTTVGETAADFLSEKLKLGLTGTTVVMSGLLIAALVTQFRARRYSPKVYWLAVVLISVVGTLITDNMTDKYGVDLVVSTVLFGIALGICMTAWYASEKTLSIHTIVTTRREAFYWLAVLFTFALGTAGGDLIAERFGVGYWKSALIFAAAIGLVYLAHSKLRLNAILAFWVAYILTRPLGASIGDYLSQKRSDGGLGLGTTVTSLLFLLTILAVVAYLTATKKDVIEVEPSSVGARTRPAPSGDARVLVVANKATATPALIDALRARAATGPARFFVLLPNPDHVLFERVSTDLHVGDQLLTEALPLLEQGAGSKITGRVATSPNAFDDIVEEVNARDYDEIILETPPTHVSHWLHVELPQRVANLGYPVTTVAAT
jgi:uncharacterized membrane-anchored protein